MNDKKLLLELSVQDIIKYIVEETEITIKEAMVSFYQSEIFEKLQAYETGLYRESPAYVYELYKDEKKFGKIVQLEV